MKACVQEMPEGITLKVYAQPGAAKTEFSGMREDALIVRISAPPRDGAANQALCEFLSKFFHVSKSKVQIVRGSTSRHKAVLIKGNAVELLTYISPLLPW